MIWEVKNRLSFNSIEKKRGTMEEIANLELKITADLKLQLPEKTFVL